MLRLDEIREKIEPIADIHGIEKIYLFGSYAKGTATEKSDLDFRIEKGALKGKGLFGFAGFFNQVEATFDVPVDIVTTDSLSKDFFDEIKKGEILIYDGTSKKRSGNSEAY